MLAAVSLVAGALYLAAQQGPKPDSSETVAKPKKKDATGKDIPNDADLPKIPSKYSTKDRIAQARSSAGISMFSAGNMET